MKGTRYPRYSLKISLLGTHARTDLCTLSAGHVARSSRRRPSANPRLTPSGTGWINPVSLLQSRRTATFTMANQTTNARIVAVSLSIALNKTSSRMTRVASLSACDSNACPYGGFAGRWGWGSRGSWALSSPVARPSLTMGMSNRSRGTRM